MSDVPSSYNSADWIKGPALEAVKLNSISLLADGHDGIIIVNFNGEYSAFQNVCLHQGLPIHAGDLDPAGFLICPWHNWCYAVSDGACLTASGAYLKQYLVRVEDDHIMVGRAFDNRMV